MSDATFTVGAVMYPGFEMLTFLQQAAEKVTLGAEYTWHRHADIDPFSRHLNDGARALGLV